MIQRSLCDGSFRHRITHLILYGTPSNGLKKAGLGQLFKRQVRDMVRDGPFIKMLRSNSVALSTAQSEATHPSPGASLTVLLQ